MLPFSLLFYRKVQIGRVDLLPRISGIYYAIDRFGDIRYIGKAVNLHDRWRRHEKEARLKLLGVTELRYRPVPKYRLLHEEAIDIEKYNPDVNRQRPTPESQLNWLIRLSMLCESFGTIGVMFVLALAISHGLGSPIPVKLLNMIKTNASSQNFSTPTHIKRAD